MSTPAADVSSETSTKRSAKYYAEYNPRTGKMPTGRNVKHGQVNSAANTANTKAQQTLPEGPDYKAMLTESMKEFEAKQRDFETLAKEKEVLSQELQKTKALVERLRLQNPEQSLKIDAEDQAAAEGVRKPTVPQMEKFLTELKPMIVALKNLQEEINTLRNNSQTKAENYGKLSKEALEEALRGNIGFVMIFKTLTERYLEQAPTITASIAVLNTIISGAMRPEIPHKHMETFSSQNLIPLSTIEEKAANYASLLKRCVDTRAEIDSEFKKAQRRFGNACDHINYIQWAIDYKAGKSGMIFNSSEKVITWPPEAKKEEKTSSVSDPTVKQEATYQQTLTAVQQAE